LAGRGIPPRTNTANRFAILKASPCEIGGLLGCYHAYRRRFSVTRHRVIGEFTNICV